VVTPEKVAASPKKAQKKRKESSQIMEEIADAMNEVPPANEADNDGFQTAKSPKKKGKKAVKDAEASPVPAAQPAPTEGASFLINFLSSSLTFSPLNEQKRR
jgi:hypothetical protein